MSFIRKLLVALSVLSAPLVVCAVESCAIQSSRLLSEGKSEQLSALFKGQAVFAPELKRLSAQVGALSVVEQVTGPRFNQYKRLIVGKTSGEYVGSWVNANSELLGPIQLHVAQSSPVKCELLALYVDFAQQPGLRPL